MRTSEDINLKLKKSRFRSSFKLKEEDIDYIKKKGLDVIAEHACQFVKERLSPRDPKNDGKQTPMKNHPVFIAQHATATCCRKCLAKWHGIPKGKALQRREVDYIVELITGWLNNQFKN